MVAPEFMSLSFQVLSQCPISNARVCTIKFGDLIVDTPVYMPVGTQGSIKGITSRQIADSSCKIMLGNTYHLGLRPGIELMTQYGGLHKLANWENALLTDSGGFQMVSLCELASVTEEGVLFKSPRDGSMMLLTPEHSMQIQKAIGANIIMQLDDVIPPISSNDRIMEATYRSIRWLDRCLTQIQPTSTQNLFAIIQGGLDLNLREICMQEMVARNTPGYAIGGLSGGEDKQHFWKVVKFCSERLPKDKPKYCMGIGYAIDILVCVALGIDMFDCVFITRTARFGHALIDSGSLSLKQSKFATDYDVIDSNCNCLTCNRYTRAFLHFSLVSETNACHLITIHNLNYQLNLMKRIRESIIKNEFPEFCKTFVRKNFQDKAIPQWIVDAFSSVNIKI